MIGDLGLKGLYHYIFLDVDIENLNAKQVQEHLAYLNEILPHLKAASESDLLDSVKARLDQRRQRLEEKEARPGALS